MKKMLSLFLCMVLIFTLFNLSILSCSADDAVTQYVTSEQFSDFQSEFEDLKDINKKTIMEKPINEYTTLEGYLCIIALILVCFLIIMLTSFLWF